MGKRDFSAPFSLPSRFQCNAYHDERQIAAHTANSYRLNLHSKLSALEQIATAPQRTTHVLIAGNLNMLSKLELRDVYILYIEIRKMMAFALIMLPDSDNITTPPSTCVVNGARETNMILRKYVPYLPRIYDNIIERILLKTLELPAQRERFNIQITTEMHSKKLFKEPTALAQYPMIYMHRNNILWGDRPHTHQYAHKVLIPLNGDYPFIDIAQCGVTQSIAFIICANQEESTEICRLLTHPLYRFLVSICKWTNFASIHMLKKIPTLGRKYDGDEKQVYYFFNLNADEIARIKEAHANYSNVVV